MSILKKRAVMLLTLSMIIISSISFLPFTAHGITNSPFDNKVESKNPFTDEGQAHNEDKDDLLENIQSKINSLYVPLFRMAILVFSIIFTLGVIGMLFSITTKNGQWMKWSTGAMIFSFLVVVTIRVGVYILYSSNVADFDEILSDIASFIASLTLLLSPFMLVCGLRLQMLYRGTEQPEYYRWARRVMFGSVSLCLLSLMMPWLFANL